MILSGPVLIWSMSVLAVATYAMHKAFSYRDERDELRAQLQRMNYRKTAKSPTR